MRSEPACEAETWSDSAYGASHINKHIVSYIGVICTARLPSRVYNSPDPGLLSGVSYTSVDVEY